MMKGNREYKSDVFSMLMEDRERALQLYNAVNRSDYRDPEAVEMHNLDKGISLTVRNDAAFVLDMSLSIYEHQSTVCPNMPIRSLVYFSVMLKKYVNDRNIYGRSLVTIPTPRFAVFYNGDEEQPEQYDLKLSDAFQKPMEKPEIELVCRVYNINSGKNRELLDGCPWLREYMTFVELVRKFYADNGHEDLKDAIERAIDRCIEENVLRNFLVAHRWEVVKAMTLDYTFDRQLMLERQEARVEGREEGRAEGRAEGREEGRAEGFVEGEEKSLIRLVCKKMKKGIAPEMIAEILEEDLEEIVRICSAAERFSPDYDCGSIYEELKLR
ncbi:MAG: transposase [Eubacterium sp.]|nr:transposase [Eubacterium sp.]MCM1409722.1 transposase [Lachnospiraceae bacterium]